VTIQLFRLTAPSEDDIRRFLRALKDSAFSYPEVGASATAVPTGYNVDHNRVPGRSATGDINHKLEANGCAGTT
jgi:hypothetical protein